MTPAQFWQIEQQNQANRQEFMQGQMENVMGGLQQLAGAYSENKQLEAKASSYDDIGKILNTAMFSQNPDAAAAFGNLQKEKDPRKKVMGYDQLFSLVGPMSNMMMAQGRLGVQQQAPFLDAALKNKRDLGAGNVPHGGGGGGMAPVEPPLPPMSQAGPVDQAPGATSPQAPSMPGGQASRDLLNRDRARRGLPPI